MNEKAYLAFNKTSLTPITVVYGKPKTMENDSTKLVELKSESIIDSVYSLLDDPEKHTQLMFIVLKQDQDKARRLESNKKKGRQIDDETKDRVIAYMIQDGSSARKAEQLFGVSKSTAINLRNSVQLS
ncbi:hypothetical protein [Microbulbifer sp. MCCC 1A16149]|uniref:hypothetical protein n=1 Tax=Microbulbifer sp. MCCC 1A16149 TaxID=3411322 RepID=UPI003D11351D